MDDLHDLLSRATDDVHPTKGGLDRVRTGVRRRQARRRVLAGLVGVVVAVGALWVAVEGFRPGALPAADEGPVDPVDVSTLRPSWSLEVPGAASVQGIETDADRIYVPTTTGVVAYPKGCSADPCSPLWHVEIVDEPSRFTELAVGAGVVAAALEGRLVVIDAECRTDGGSCQPLWQIDGDEASNGYRSPVIAEQVVMANNTYGEVPEHRVRVEGFAVRCRDDGNACQPLWRADFGVGPVYVPGTVVSGVFYQQVGTRKLGVEIDCSAAGETCEPNFVVEIEGDPSTQESVLYGPVPGPNELVFVEGRGSVVAYPEACGVGCRPLWIGRTDDHLETDPVVARDLVVVSYGGGLLAYPLGCGIGGHVCAAAWDAELDGYAGIEYADDRFVVAVDRAQNTGISIFPTQCASPCEPVWSLDRPGPVYGVTSDGEHLFVAFGTELAAYPLACGDPCEPVWRSPVPDETWWILLDGSHIVTASRTNAELGSGLALRIFEAN